MEPKTSTIMWTWTDEAPGWAHIDPDLQQFPRQPPPI